SACTTRSRPGWASTATSCRCPELAPPTASRTNEPMNWIDYAIIGVLGLSVLIGLWRGLVAEVLALVVWAAAFWVAWVFGPAVASHFGTIITLPSARIIAGYGLCFVAVLVLGALLRFVVARLVASTGLSGTDRLLGMIFGL